MTDQITAKQAATSPASSEFRIGIFNAIGAYAMWGLAPLYFKYIDHVAVDEIMIHRVVWSSIILFAIILISKKWRQLTSLVKQTKVWFQFFLTALVLAINWLLFIWAVNNDHLLDASLGYFINPLLNVALGVIFLGERLRKWQLFAVLLAIVGVLIQLIIFGSLPVISLVLASTFAAYGLLKKKFPVDSLLGLFIESLIMLPIAAFYWLVFIESTTSNMVNNDMSLNVALIFAGVVTTAPLLCFTAAAKRLALSMVGFIQYIGPSIMFLLATFYYYEPVSMAKLLTFAFIWLALFIYSIDSYRFHKRKNVVSQEN